MNVVALRAAGAVFVIGLLFVWLVRPVGNPCPDVEKLPNGSEASSAPSFAPPLTRTCTYTTPEGTQAHKRYVPVLDLVALLLVAGVVGSAIAVQGPAGRPAARARGEHAPGREQPEPSPMARGVRDQQSQGKRDAAQRERDALERARARQEREARRGR